MTIWQVVVDGATSNYCCCGLGSSLRLDQCWGPSSSQFTSMVSQKLISLRNLTGSTTTTDCNYDNVLLYRGPEDDLTSVHKPTSTSWQGGLMSSFCKWIREVQVQDCIKEAQGKFKCWYLIMPRWYNPWRGRMLQVYLLVVKNNLIIW
jgi:hypothetical protein